MPSGGKRNGAGRPLTKSNATPRKTLEHKRPPKRSLTLKQAKYITGLSEGKSRRKAALDAGYSQACADNARYAIEGSTVREELGKIMHRYVDPHKIGQRIAEGLDAVETRIFQHRGVITDSINLIAWGERRQYARLAADFCGYYGDDKEIDHSSTPGDLSQCSDEELKYIIEHHGELPPDKA